MSPLSPTLLNLTAPPFLSYSRPRLHSEPAPGIETVHDVMLYAARTHGSKKGFGSRKVVKVIEEEKEVTKKVGGKDVKETKKWSYFKLSPYSWVSYEEALALVKQIGAGLRTLGVENEKESFFNIYASTS